METRPDRCERLARDRPKARSVAPSIPPPRGDKPIEERGAGESNMGDIANFIGPGIGAALLACAADLMCRQLGMSRRRKAGTVVLVFSGVLVLAIGRGLTSH
jgi:hypothetical protein